MSIKKQVNQSQLALLRRRLVDPKLRENYPAEYLAEIRLSGWKEINWTRFREDAELYDKSRLKRDIFERIELLSVEYRDFKIQINGESVETEFEVVELIEKKSFGFLIRRKFKDTYEYLKGDETIVGSKLDAKYWETNPLLVDVYKAEAKDRLLEKLKQCFPDEQFSSQELFCE